MNQIPLKKAACSPKTIPPISSIDVYTHNHYLSQSIDYPNISIFRYPRVIIPTSYPNSHPLSPCPIPSPNTHQKADIRGDGIIKLKGTIIDYKKIAMLKDEPD